MRETEGPAASPIICCRAKSLYRVTDEKAGQGAACNENLIYMSVSAELLRPCSRMLERGRNEKRGSESHVDNAEALSDTHALPFRKVTSLCKSYCACCLTYAKFNTRYDTKHRPSYETWLFPHQA